MGRKEFIIVLLLTFLVMVVWVATDILTTAPSIEQDPKLQKLLEPIDSNFNTDILNKYR